MYPSNIIKTMLYNILTAFYQPFWFAIILSIFFMFAYKLYPGVKAASKQWILWFKEDVLFRKMFVLVFYTSMILFRTLLNRDMWANPLSNVLGNWGLWNQNGVLSTEIIENFILFIPFVIILFWTYKEKIFFKKVTLIRALWISAKITFSFSLTIEMLQLLLRLGTWQLSDLFFNTLGGIAGGGIYYFFQKITCILMNRKKQGGMNHTP